MIGALTVENGQGNVASDLPRFLHIDANRTSICVSVTPSVPALGHTDGYDGFGLGLNRSVKIFMCYRSNSVYIRPGSAYIYASIYKAQA